MVVPRFTLKRRVTLELSPYCVDLIDHVAKDRLGVGRNAFLSIAALRWALEFEQIAPKPKRKNDLRKLQEALDEVQGKINKAL